ncbi:peptidase M15 [Candidatus Poribacteria bacterium]|nr:MAG: peptidase M15 [Candidatus Poribacteria bacterium]
MGDLSFHFSRSEFVCPCCGELVIDMELIDQLERLRFLVGRPIKVLSGYRCQRHNREVGGAPNSQHLLGRAADIRVEGMDSLRLFLEAVRCEFGGIGIYPDFIHVDVRREPFRALWGRRADGRYVSAAEAIAELFKRER